MCEGLRVEVEGQILSLCPPNLPPGWREEEETSPAPAARFILGVSSPAPLQLHEKPTPRVHLAVPSLSQMAQSWCRGRWGNSKPEAISSFVWARKDFCIDGLCFVLFC